MGIEIKVDSEALLSALQSRANELPDRLNQLGNEAANIVKRNAVDEAPRRTGNLKASIWPVSTGPMTWVIAPDEGVAPYALYVLLGTRFQTANPFLDRAERISRSEIDDEIALFEKWLTNI